MRNEGAQPRDHCLPPHRYATILSVLDRSHQRWPSRDQKKTDRDFLGFFPSIRPGKGSGRVKARGAFMACRF